MNQDVSNNVNELDDQKNLENAFQEKFPNARLSREIDTGALVRPSLESRTLKKTQIKQFPSDGEIEVALDGMDIPVFDKWEEPSYRVKVKRYVTGDIKVIAVFQEENLQFKNQNRQRKVKDRSEMDEEYVMRSVARSKRAVREKVIQIKADRLVTLTTRRDLLCFGEFASYCDEFMRLFRKRHPDRQYVLVFEKHKSGAYHAHIATSGYFDYKALRRLWHYALTGENRTRFGEESPGNIDVKNPQAKVRGRKGRSHQGKQGNAAGLAQYISKHISKNLDVGEFNKKRY